MNPFELDATGLMVWGLVAHLIADWPLQNDWMAANKAKRRSRVVCRDDDGSALIHSDLPGDVPWWDRHPAAIFHADVHLVLLAFVFGWVALPLALVHLVIDTRTPVAWWSRLVRQTQPRPQPRALGVLVDIGTEVRFWTDQVFHIACIAIAALVVGCA